MQPIVFCYCSPNEPKQNGMETAWNEESLCPAPSCLSSLLLFFSVSPCLVTAFCPCFGHFPLWVHQPST